MRRKADRSSDILSLLTNASGAQMDVADLARSLGVSQVTIRKDLDALEARGILRREHGFAMLTNRSDLGCRMAYHYEAKRKIAKKAASLVKNGETLMIENGSCCALLAEVLTKTHSDLTIITNSAAIASHIHGLSNFQIILLGGIYQQDSQVLVGPMIASGVEDFYVDHFFIGTDGWSEETGFTNEDQLRAQAVRDMSRHAREVIVVTESEKFGAGGTIPLRIDDAITTVITDAGIDKKWTDVLNAKDVEIITSD